MSSSPPGPVVLPSSDSEMLPTTYRSAVLSGFARVNPSSDRRCLGPCSVTSLSVHVQPAAPPLEWPIKQQRLAPDASPLDNGLWHAGRVDDDAVVRPFRPAPDAIEFRHLRSFVAVAEELSFVRAAQRLYISQPALSRQIRGLERLLGCDLFRRSTQRVELTVAGEALLARVGEVLGALDDAIATTRSVGGEFDAMMSASWEPWVQASAAETDVDAMRVAVEELHGQFAPPPEVRISSAIAGGVPALTATPDKPSGARVLYLHGGGYVAGSAFGYRHLAGAIASASAATVTVIDYRLAPEHPFPAGLHDAIDAYRWLLGLPVPAEDIIVIGDSSGGGLAMSLLLALPEHNLPVPAAAALLCPWRST